MVPVRTPTVIVVDDDVISRKVVAGKLRSLATVFEAGDGVEALNQLTCVKVDLAIIDLEMPRLGGVELIRCLRGDPNLKHIPIIVLTANESRGGPELALAAGATSFLLKPLNWAAFGAHIRHVLELAHRANHLALHDTLTGLPNRSFFGERLIETLRDVGPSIAAAHLIDLDLFKYVNDTLGHPVGDQLLEQVGQRLHRLMAPGFTAARLGGDEFAFIQTGIGSPDEACSFAQEVIDDLSQPYQIDGRRVVIGATIGITLIDHPDLSPETVMQSADLALYAAKRQRRGTHCMFEQKMQQVFRDRVSLEEELRSAVLRSEFELYFQPIFNIATQQIISLEALIRWSHPEKGILPPSRFMEVAEETGLIHQIGEWVMRQACFAAANLPEDIKVAVNVSAKQFSDGDLTALVKNALADSGISPNRLEIEITESHLLVNSQRTMAILGQLRELGVPIVMDDFGTGFSSLSYLQSFPFDKIKIDKSFVERVTDDAGSAKIIRLIGALARELGMTAVVEGVETGAQLEALTRIGLMQIQGYLISKPLPLDGTLSLLRRNAVHQMRLAAAEGTVAVA